MAAVSGFVDSWVYRTSERGGGPPKSRMLCDCGGGDVYVAAEAFPSRFSPGSTNAAQHPMALLTRFAIADDSARYDLGKSSVRLGRSQIGRASSREVLLSPLVPPRFCVTVAWG